MKIKKFLPHVTTAVLSAIILIFALFSKVLRIETTPFRLMEKLGIYSAADGIGYGIMNNAFSFNGTHEFFVSAIKELAVSDTISALIPAVIISIIMIAVLTFGLNSASKTNYMWTTFLCAVLLPLVFCDYSNVVYFKTLYQYPLILILLLLICGMFMRFYKNNKAGTLGIILLAAATVVYSCLGTVQAVTAIVFGLLIIRLRKISSNSAAKIITIILGTAVILQSVIFTLTYKSVDYKQSLYNSVFFGVCRYDSVAEIGLDPKLDDFKEVYYGMKDDESDYDLENSFYNKVSYKTLIKYYLTHPINTVKLLNNEAKAAFFNTYEYPFTAYSTVKKLYIPSGLAMVLAVTVVYILVALFIGRKYNNLKYVTEFLSGLALIWLISLIAATVQNGNCDIASNMYTFNVIFDILLVSAIIGGIRVLLKMRDDKKAQFGITHE